MGPDTNLAAALTDLANALILAAQLGPSLVFWFVTPLSAWSGVVATLKCCCRKVFYVYMTNVRGRVDSLERLGLLGSGGRSLNLGGRGCVDRVAHDFLKTGG